MFTFQMRSTQNEQSSMFRQSKALPTPKFTTLTSTHITFLGVDGGALGQLRTVWGRECHKFCDISPLAIHMQVVFVSPVLCILYVRSIFGVRARNQLFWNSTLPNAPHQTQNNKHNIHTQTEFLVVSSLFMCLMCTLFNVQYFNLSKLF